MRSATLRPRVSTNWTGTGGRAFQDGGIGNDWGVFTTTINSSTRRHAGAVQRSWFRFSTAVTSSTTIEGHGADTGVDNFTLQIHAAPSKARSGNTVRYRADTRGGNSGSPVVNGSGLAIGVHSHGGCTSSSSTASSNAGTYQGHPSFVLWRNRLCTTPDLVVDTITSNSTTLRAGSTYTMSTRIRNAGTGSTAASFVSAIVLSTNTTISTADPVLRSFTTPTLLGGRSYTFTSSTIRIPTNTRSGTCYLAGFADRSAYIGESNEANNTRFVTRTCVGVTARPNLVVTAVSATTSVVAGGNATIRATVRNTGTATAAASLTGYYLSTNSAITTSDTLLGSSSTRSLAASIGVTLSRVVRMPLTLPTGTCYLGAYADYRRTVTESNEVDNGRGQAVRCTGRGNLQISALTASTTSAVAGSLVTLRATVRNAGSNTAAASLTGYYLSSDSRITTTDTLLGSSSTPSIAAGRTSLASRSVRIPSTVRTVTCYLGAYADYRNTVSEASEVDNGRGIAVRCIARPDLTVTACTYSASGTTWVPGAAVTVRATVRNAGFASSPSSIATVLMSTNTLISSSDIYLTGRTVGALAPGASVSTSVSVRVPYCLTSTSYYIGAYADGFLRVTEGSEGNNGRAASPVRRVSAYTGSGRIAEFRFPRAGNTNGANSLTGCQVSVRRGANVPICITAPRFNNYWVYPIWSRSSSLRIDDLTNLSLSLPIYTPRIVRVSSGRAQFSLTIPRVPTFVGGFNAYMHTVWFTPTFSGINSLSGTNRLFNRFTQ